jgi:hypothetical protein
MILTDCGNRLDAHQLGVYLPTYLMKGECKNDSMSAL